jgi:hypothetical protein
LLRPAACGSSLWVDCPPAQPDTRRLVPAACGASGVEAGRPRCWRTLLFVPLTSGTSGFAHVEENVRRASIHLESDQLAILDSLDSGLE